jgi:guanylate kinase
MGTNAEPLVFIVSGPSGSGKSTLVQSVLDLPNTLLSVSCTTRTPRQTESRGKWYNFVSEAEFERMKQAGEFLEYAQVFGKNWYGTPRRWLDEARVTGKNLVLEIDVQGAQQVKQKLPKALAIFIVPPSRAELEKRIRSRGQDSDDEIARRLERARQELEQYTGYDFIVINDDRDRAVNEVQGIVLAARCATKRNEDRVKEILKSFGG